MLEESVAALPPFAFILSILALVVFSAALGALVQARLSNRRRSHDAEDANSISADHASEDHDLLWRALGAHVMVNVADDAGRTVSVNDSFSEATGYGPEEIIGRRLRDFLFLPGTASRDDVVQAIRCHGQWTGETNIRRKDGSRLWTRTTIVGLCNKAGELVRTVAVRTDITRNKVSQDDVQKRLLLERLNDEVYVFDARDLSLCYLNRADMRHRSVTAAVSRESGHSGPGEVPRDAKWEIGGHQTGEEDARDEAWS